MRRLLVVFIGLLLAGVIAAPARTSAAEDNLIVNPSMEEDAGTGAPVGWIANKWGNNTASHEYLNEGHTGNRSVKTEVTEFTDGDAKWYFDPVDVMPDKSYLFTNYYKSNTLTEVVVQFTHNDSSQSYQWLGTAQASPDWTQASFTFNTPANAQKVSIFHVVASVGWMIMDDASLSEFAPPPPPSSDNLISNSSVEQVDAGNPNKPQDWQGNNWGNNTAEFTYMSTGHTGLRSVKTELTQHADGDAKWWFDRVSVTPGSKYDYSDYYQSSVGTNVFAWFTHADGSSTYEWLGMTPASPSIWQQATFSFDVPASATQVSIFHVVSSVGWLILDDAELKESALPATNPVPNPSVEQASTEDSSRPDMWHADQWGSNTANYEYLNEGHTGDRSVKVTVSDYVDGDAKWYFEPITSLESGQSYSFNAWYKTNTTPHVAVAYTMDDGSNLYRGLRDPFPPSSSEAEWQQYSESFTVPSNVQSATVYFFVNTSGWLQVDDYSIQPYEPVGFDQPLVSLTFDDSFIDNVDTAFPVMESYGFKSTQCYGTAFVEAVPEGEPAVHTFNDAGHEICSHTVTHPFLSQLTPSEVDFELAHSQEVLEGIIDEQVINFASPFGDYDFDVYEATKNYYRSHRTVDEGYNSKDNFDTHRVLVQNLLVDTTIQEFQSWLDHAEATNTWLVLVYHRVTSASDIEPFDTPEDEFQTQMQALDASGLTVKTYNDALDELLPQL